MNLTFRLNLSVISALEVLFTCFIGSADALTAVLVACFLQAQSCLNVLVVKVLDCEGSIL